MANPRPTPPNSAMSVNSSLSSGLRFPSNRRTIYDRNLNRSRNLELSRASFGYLFAQMIVYAQNRVQGIGDLERK